MQLRAYLRSAKPTLVLLGVVVCLYLVCMLIIPWMQGGLSWDYVQKVWGYWQTFNVGMLALISSLVALIVASRAEDEKRRRSLASFRSFLPEALSELSSYLESSANLLLEAWRKAVQGEALPFQARLPALPGGYKEIFRGCIANDQEQVSFYLSRVLVLLQVHHSRLTAVHSAEGARGGALFQQNLLSYLFSLGEIKGLVDLIFDYARGERSFCPKPLGWDAFRSAYRIMGIHFENVAGLEAFTRARLPRTGHIRD